MNTSLSLLTQSQYYSPLFNSAIFDGVFRIYFNQPFESKALKFYFQLQAAQEKHLFDEAQDAHIFVLMYPTADAFSMAFGEGSWPSGSVQMAKSGQDWIIGVLEDVDDKQWTHVLDILQKISKSIGPRPVGSHAAI